MVRRQLLIDYSKNTAPLQKDGGRERLQVGMSLRYHEPLMGPDELDMSASSLGSRSKVHPPNPSFPLQFLDQVEKELQPQPIEESEERRPRSPARPRGRQRSSPSRGKSKSKSPSKSPSRGLSPQRQKKPSLKAMVTFQVPSIAAIRQRCRFDVQKLHHSDSDISFFDRTNHTAPSEVETTTTKRNSIVSSADTFADESTNMSIRTAPAAAASALQEAPQKPERRSLDKTLQKMSPSKNPIEEAAEEEEEVDDDETNNFLPSGLTNDRPVLQEKLPSVKKKKKRQQPSLDEWFSRDSSRSLDELPSIRSKTPTRSNRKSRRKQLKKSLSHGPMRNGGAPLRRSVTLNDASSLAGASISQMSTSQRSLMTTSQRSLVSHLSQSYPTGPRRRMLPKRNFLSDESDSVLQTEDSNRSLSTNASARTRRGGRRPGNQNKSYAREAPTNPKKALLRSLSSADIPSNSFRNLKSAENSFSFMAGSRIRIRRTGTNKATNGDDIDDDASASLILPSNPPRRRRAMLTRTKSCEEMPSLLRSS